MTNWRCYLEPIQYLAKGCIAALKLHSSLSHLPVLRAISTSCTSKCSHTACMQRDVHGCTNAAGAGSAGAAFLVQFCLALHPFSKILNRFLFCLMIIPADVLAKGWDVFVSAGLDYGKDEVDVILFIENEETYRVDAGGYTQLAAGIQMPAGPDTDLEFSYGWKSVSLKAQNGKVRFDRFPLEVIGFYNFNRMRAGAGVSYHQRPVLEENLGIPRKIAFDNSTGLVLQLDYFAYRHLTIGARLLFLEYQEKNGGEAINGASIGLFMSLRLKGFSEE